MMGVGSVEGAKQEAEQTSNGTPVPSMLHYGPTGAVCTSLDRSINIGLVYQ